MLPLGRLEEAELLQPWAMGSVEQNTLASWAWLPTLPAPIVLELIPGSASATWEEGVVVVGKLPEGSVLGRQPEVLCPREAPGFVRGKAQLEVGKRGCRASEDPLMTLHATSFRVRSDPHTLNYILMHIF